MIHIYCILLLCLGQQVHAFANENDNLYTDIACSFDATTCQGWTINGGMYSYGIFANQEPTGQMADKFENKLNSYLILKRNSSKPVDLIKTVQNSVSGTGGSNKCLSFWYKGVSGPILPVTLLMQYDQQEKIVWRLQHANKDEWKQVVLELPLDLTKIVLQSELIQLKLSSWAVFDGPCDVQSNMCDFELNTGCKFNLDTVSNFQVVQAHNTGADLPKIDASLMSSKGHYLITNPRTGNSSDHLTSFPIRHPNGNTNEIASSCLKFKLFKPDQNRHLLTIKLANLQQHYDYVRYFWVSNTFPLSHLWQTVQINVVYLTDIKVYFDTESTNISKSDLPLAIDDITFVPGRCNVSCSLTSGSMCSFTEDHTLPMGFVIHDIGQDFPKNTQNEKYASFKYLSVDFNQYVEYIEWLRSMGPEEETQAESEEDSFIEELKRLESADQNISNSMQNAQNVALGSSLLNRNDQQQISAKLTTPMYTKSNRTELKMLYSIQGSDDSEFVINIWLTNVFNKELLLSVDTLAQDWSLLKIECFPLSDFHLEFEIINFDPKNAVKIGLTDLNVRAVLSSQAEQETRIDRITCDFREDLCGWQNKGLLKFVNSNFSPDNNLQGYYTLNTNSMQMQNAVLESPLYSSADHFNLNVYCLNIVYKFESNTQDSRLKIYEKSNSKNPVMIELPVQRDSKPMHQTVQFSKQGDVRLVIKCQLFNAMVQIHSVVLYKGLCHQLQQDKKVIDFEHGLGGWVSGLLSTSLHRFRANQVHPDLTDISTRTGSGHVYGFTHHQMLSLPILAASVLFNQYSPSDICVDFFANINLPGILVVGFSEMPYLKLEVKKRENFWYHQQVQMKVPWIKTKYLYVMFQQVDQVASDGFVVFDQFTIEQGPCAHRPGQRDSWTPHPQAIQYIDIGESASNARQMAGTYGFMLENKSKHDRFVWHMGGTKALLRNTKIPVELGQKEICVSLQYWNAMADARIELSLLIGSEGQFNITKHSRIILEESKSWTDIELQADVSNLSAFVPFLMIQSSVPVYRKYLSLANLNIEPKECKPVSDHFKCRDEQQTQIGANKVCDFQIDCPNQLDEQYCGSCDFGLDTMCDYSVLVTDGAKHWNMSIESTSVNWGNLLKPVHKFLNVMLKQDVNSENKQTTSGVLEEITLESPWFQPQNRDCALTFKYSAQSISISVQIVVQDSNPFSIWQSGTSDFDSKPGQMNATQVYLAIGNGFEKMKLQFNFIHNPNSMGSLNGTQVPQSGLSSIELINCGLSTNVSCGPNEFQCQDLRKCIPLTSVCDLVFDCSDLSDELNCLEQKDALNFEGEFDYEKHAQHGSFVHVVANPSPLLGPVLDHTWLREDAGYVRMGLDTRSHRTVKLGNDFLRYLSMSDPRFDRQSPLSCTGYMYNFNIYKNPDCQLKLSVSSNVSSGSVALNLAMVGSNSNHFLSLNPFNLSTSADHWNTYILNVTSSYLPEQIKVYLVFQLQDCRDWIALDDVLFLPQCYPPKLTDSDCFYFTNSPNCNWKINLLLPSFELKLLSALASQMPLNLKSVQHTNHENYRMFYFKPLNPKINKAQLSFKSPAMYDSSLNKYVLKIELFTFGPEVGELNFYQNPFLSFKTRKEHQFHLMSIRNQMLPFGTIIYIPIQKVDYKFEIVIKASNFGSDSFFAISYMMFVSTKSVPNNYCLFEINSNCAEIGQSPQINQFQLVTSEYSKIPDHTLNSVAGAYLTASPNQMMFRKVIKLKKLLGGNYYIISFWYTTWTLANENQCRCNSNNGTCTENWSDQMNGAAAPLLIVKEIFGLELFRSQVALHGQWKQIRIPFYRKYSSDLIIMAQFDQNNMGQASAHSLAVDDLQISIDSTFASPLDCDFRAGTTCGWFNIPDSQYSTWNVMAADHWASQILRVSNVTQYLQTNHLTNILYIEFDETKKQRHAQLISPLIQLRNKKHCLLINFSSHPLSNITLSVWRRDVTGSRRIESVQEANSQWQTVMVPVQSEHPSSTDPVFELSLVATSGGLGQKEWLAIRSVKYDGNACDGFSYETSESMEYVVDSPSDQSAGDSSAADTRLSDAPDYSAFRTGVAILAIICLLTLTAIWTTRLVIGRTRQ